MVRQDEFPQFMADDREPVDELKWSVPRLDGETLQESVRVILRCEPHGMIRTNS